MSALRKFIASALLTVIALPTPSVMALTVQQAVNSIQATDLNLPTGVANPKGYIGSLLSELFWGTGDGAKNGKIKPQYIDYSGISAWTQSGVDVFASGTGNIGIGTTSPAYKLQVVANLDDVGLRINNSAIRYRSDFARSATDLSINAYDDIAGVYQPIQLDASFHRFSISGSEKVRIDSSGNVGIGTTSPSDLLTLSGATGPIIGLNGAITNYRGIKMANNAGTEQWFAGANNVNNYVVRQNGSTDLMTFSGGNVGIGTTSPTEKLFVANGEAHVDYANGGSTRGSAISLLSNANFSYIASNRYYDLVGLVDRYARNGGSSWINFDTTTGATAGDIIFQTAVSGVANASLTRSTVMTIKQSGNVGIGTTSPNDFGATSKSLEIAGSAYGYLRLTGGTSTFDIMTWTGGVSELRSSSDMGFKYAGVEKMRINNKGLGIGTSAQSPLHVHATSTNSIQLTNGTTTAGTGRGSFLGISGSDLTLDNSEASSSIIIKTQGTERMRVNSSGNVGIGTSNPGNMLSIGSLGFSGGGYGIQIGQLNAETNISFGEDNANYAVMGWNDISNYVNFKTRSAGTTYDNNLVLKNGNIGIGIATPVSNLHIANSSAPATLSLDNTRGVADKSSALKFKKGGNDLWGIMTDPGQTGAQSLSIWDFVSGTSRFMIDSSGNVGIGTTPNDKLTIAGSTNMLRFTPDNGIILAQTLGFSNSILELRGSAVHLNPQGSTGLYINNLSQVGIGTKSPSDLLTLSGATGPIIGLNGATTNYRGLKMSNSAGTEQWFAGANNVNNYVVRQNGSTDLMTFSGGNVGIGASTPSESLSVNGNIKALYSFVSKIPTTSVTGANSWLRVGSTGNPYTSISYAELLIRIDGGRGDGIARVIFTCVGFGNCSLSVPEYYSTTPQNSTSQGLKGLRIVYDNSVFSNPAYLDINTIDDGTGYPSKYSIYLIKGENFILQTSLVDATTSTPAINYPLTTTSSQINHLFSNGKVVLLSSGNVGIGTTSPNSKLQVTNGDVYIETQGKGVILRDTDGAGCHRLTVNTAGTMAVSAVTCP